MDDQRSPCCLTRSSRETFVLQPGFLLHHPNQFAEPHPQRVGDAPEGVHVGVFGARLDHGKVAAGHPGQAGQHLLGQILPDAQITDDAPGDFAVVWNHGFSPFANRRRCASIRGRVFFANFAKGKKLSAKTDRKKKKACYASFESLLGMRTKRNGG